MDLFELLQNLGITTLIAAAASISISQFIKFRFTKAEKDIDLKLSESLESHKSLLQNMYYKSSKLHERRIEVISKLYSNIVAVDISMKHLTSFFKQSSGDQKIDDENDKQDIIEAGKLYREVQTYYLQNKIFFEQDLCELIDDLFTTYWDSYWDYSYPMRFKGTGVEFSLEKAQKASETISKAIPPILAKLIDEFRAILSVNK